MNYLRRIGRGLANRWRILRQYATTSPTVLGVPRWLALGALSSRLFGGASRARPLSTGQPRNFWVPIGERRKQGVIVDISSFSELDVLREVLVDKIYPFDRVGFIPRMILDCGANVGYFASLARVNFPETQVVCWEPDAYNFGRLKSQPLLSDEDVTCFHAAVSDTDGAALLSGTGPGCMLIASPTEKCRVVKTVDIARWIESYGCFPLLLKIDVEGHEQQILRAMRGKWKGPCVMFLETHAENGDDQNILRDLAADEFTINMLRSHNIANDTQIFKEYVCTLN